jgi:hypothetical protein
MQVKCIAKNKATPKHQFYMYWGYNRSRFSSSDLHMKGSNYDVVLNNIKATDRPTPFSVGTYFNFFRLTIPQFNARAVYIHPKKWQFGIGTDHMKYVMVQNQRVFVNGQINMLDNEYNGVYQKKNTEISEKFLTFEHTDGLNYINADARKMKTFGINKWWSLETNFGAGLGILFPKTNAKVLDKERYDDYKISGMGIHTVLGCRLQFANHFFITTEGKLGYINMPSIRTTQSSTDKASQQFTFAQWNFGMGYQFGIGITNK